MSTRDDNDPTTRQVLAGPREVGDRLDPCLSCGADGPAGSRFCRRCGRPLAASLPSTGAAGGAEHKQVTVLFADVQGSIAISERLDPEEWYRIVARFVAILADGVQRAGGFVNRFTGDGIMALFGAPIAQEDHARRACHAALRLKRALARYAAELRASHGVDLGVRMGLNSGGVVTAALGEGRPASYTALGGTVRLAAMLERLATPGRVLVSERTAALLASDFQLTDLGCLQGPDGDPPVRAYELCGHGFPSVRAEGRRVRSPFVGRAAEMRLLEAGLEEARAGRGTVIAIRGEVGVGKSRLCREFVQQCRNEGVATYHWRALSHLRSTPLLSLIIDLRRLFGVRPDDASALVRWRIETSLRALGGTAHELLPYFARLLGATFEARDLPPAEDLERLRPLIAGFARSLGAKRPAVVLVEDVQWVDSASGRLLEAFLEGVAGSGVLAVLNFRPDPRVRPPRGVAYEEIDLEPLGRRATSELLRNLLGDDPALAALANEIRDRAGGNPFFIEELVTVLAETGVLVGARGAYRPGPRRERVEIPSSLHAVLESRIDLLPAEHKGVLQLAAVLGRTFPLELLRRVATLADERLARSLAALKEAGFLVEAERASGEAHYSFRHPLMQEEAYYTRVSDVRAAAHAEVARACVELYAGSLDERASLIAHHWQNANDFLQAALWERRAAAWLSQRNLSEGLRRWKRVCTLLEQAPASAEAYGLAVYARTKILLLGARLGLSAHESKRVFDEARRLATHAGEPRGLALLCFAFAQARASVGDTAAGLEMTREALRHAERAGDRRLRLRVRVGLVYAYFNAGRFREALAECASILRDADRDDGPESHQLAYAYFFHGMLCADMGRPLDALRALEEAAELAWRHADPELLCQVYGFAPVVDRTLGLEPAGSLERAQRAVELAEYLGSPFARVHAYWGYGAAHLLAGEARTACKILNRVLLLARDHGVALHGEAGILADLALATLRRGDGAVALSLADEAVEAARRNSTTLYECIARLARVHVLLEVKGVAAGAEVERELALVESRVAADGTASFAPVVHFRLAALARLRGDERRAEEETRTARRLFAAMGAGGWVARIDGRVAREAAA